MSPQERCEVLARLSADEVVCEAQDMAAGLISGGVILTGVALAIGALAAPLWRWWIYRA